MNPWIAKALVLAGTVVMITQWCPRSAAESRGRNGQVSVLQTRHVLPGAARHLEPAWRRSLALRPSAKSRSRTRRRDVGVSFTVWDAGAGTCASTDRPRPIFGALNCGL